MNGPAPQLRQVCPLNGYKKSSEEGNLCSGPVQGHVSAAFLNVKMRTGPGTSRTDPLSTTLTLEELRSWLRQLYRVVPLSSNTVRVHGPKSSGRTRSLAASWHCGN